MPRTAPPARQSEPARCAGAGSVGGRIRAREVKRLFAAVGSKLTEWADDIRLCEQLFHSGDVRVRPAGAPQRGGSRNTGVPALTWVDDSQLGRRAGVERGVLPRHAGGAVRHPMAAAGSQVRQPLPGRGSLSQQVSHQMLWQCLGGLSRPAAPYRSPQRTGWKRLRCPA